MLSTAGRAHGGAQVLFGVSQRKQSGDQWGSRPAETLGPGSGLLPPIGANIDLADLRGIQGEVLLT